MTSSVLHVVGEVVGKPRPRFTSYGGRMRTFTPKKGETFESLVRVAYQAQGGTMLPQPSDVGETRNTSAQGRTPAPGTVAERRGAA